jgi:diphosphomevalonate decarboxylase
MMIFAEAPSNIALIKYMGKVKGSDRNRPTNPSISLTLPNLLSRVELTPASGHYDEWQYLSVAPWVATTLSEKGRKRYLAHFEFLKQKFEISGHYLVRSANNFPSDCGIASSASSFAALTMATYKLACALRPGFEMAIEKVAELSRLGSGSSIRSFMGPFVIWDDAGIRLREFPYEGLIHQVVVVDKEKKAIGSTEAHEMVTSSFLFDGRPERAAKRLEIVLDALDKKDWKQAYEVCWAEFWDMHSLFSTSQPPFQYMTKDSLGLLSMFQDLWKQKSRGPIVTMDAGANIHLIWRSEDADLALQMKDFCAPFEVLGHANNLQDFDNKQVPLFDLN